MISSNCIIAEDTR